MLAYMYTNRLKPEPKASSKNIDLNITCYVLIQHTIMYILMNCNNVFSQDIKPTLVCHL